MNGTGVGVSKVLLLLLAAVCWMGAASVGSALGAEKEKAGAAQASKSPAAPEPGEAKGAGSPQGESRDEGEETPVVTHHTFDAAGKPFAYTATAGRMRLTDASGKPKADVFYVAYTRDDAANDPARPVSFAFNGGPGAASIWLHMGAIGPVRAPVQDREVPPPPPYRMTPNAYSWLPFTDLVFIDPVGTGFSRPAAGEDGKQFYGVKEDLEWVGEFVRKYVTRAGRWGSPKFLVGESYGTYRAVGLADRLFERYGMEVNGVVLLSPAINFQTFLADPGNDLPYALFLPSYAAAAWYHGKLGGGKKEDLATVTKRVESWVVEKYAGALLLGDALPEGERDSVAGTLTDFTGLPKDLILRKNLRVERRIFLNELLKSDDLSLGILDSRATRRGPSAGFLSDPGTVVTVAPFAAVFNDYVRSNLGYRSDLPYIMLSEEVNAQWSWGSAIQGHVGVEDTLKGVLTRNRYFKVFVAAGYYDLDTPFYSSEYTFRHLGLPPGTCDNITFALYEAGHMVYTNLDALEAFTEDVTAFYGSAVPKPAAPAGK